MKLFEIITPKKPKKQKGLPSLLRPQHGEKLSVRDKVELAQKVKNNETPAFAKRQAESVEG